MKKRTTNAGYPAEWNEKMVTKQQASLAMNVIVLIAETIREAKQIPAGTLYAHLMTQGCTIGQFNSIVRILVGSGTIKKEASGMLTWII